MDSGEKIITSADVRKKYIEFFVGKGHKQIDPSPLVLEDDPTTLFTSSGMQQLIPYLKGEKDHPKGKKLVNSQPCLRTQDIEEVGDNRHTTFFEMLGNWSIGDYFKKEQLKMVWEFFTEELGLPKEKLWITVFKGTKEVPKDKESYDIWKEIGVPEKRIKYYGVKENWWSRSGSPEKMPAGGIGGPDSEIFYDFGEEHKFHEKSDIKKDCLPGCECGRFLEIGNSVFIQYKKTGDGKLEELPQKSVDFGGGLERLVSAVNDNPDIFQTDLYMPIIKKIEKVTGKNYKESEYSIRIIADHLRASEALIVDGVKPGNKLQGYVLRRLIRRAVYQMIRLEMNITKDLPKISGPIIGEEAAIFQRTLNEGIKYLDNQPTINAKVAFNSLTSYGIPFEITRDLATTRGETIDKNKFDQEVQKHKKLSKTKSAGKFKGGSQRLGVLELKDRKKSDLT